LETYLNTLFTE